MLSNAYFLAKIRFDTAENEPAKNLQILHKICHASTALGSGAAFALAFPLALGSTSAVSSAGW